MKKLTTIFLLLASSIAMAAGRIQNEDIKSLTEIRSSVNTITGNLTLGSPCIAAPSSLARLGVGQFLYDVTTPANIPAGTTILALPGACPAGQIRMSANAAGNGVGDTITIGGQMSQLPNASKIYIDHVGINKQFTTAIGDGSLFSASSPLTTKGDILTYSTQAARLPIGANDFLLMADTAPATGNKWGQAVTNSIADAAITNAKLAAPNIQISASTGAMTLPIATPTIIATVTITGSGQPIRLSLEPDGGPGLSQVGVIAAGGGADWTIKFCRAASPVVCTNIISQSNIAISGMSVGNRFQLAPSEFSATDSTYTPGVVIYTVEAELTSSGVNGASPLYITNVVLKAYEK